MQNDDKGLPSIILSGQDLLVKILITLEPHGLIYQILQSNILSVNEKLPPSKFGCLGKYIIQLFGYCYVHVFGQ